MQVQKRTHDITTYIIGIKPVLFISRNPVMGLAYAYILCVAGNL